MTSLKGLALDISHVSANGLVSRHININGCNIHYVEQGQPNQYKVSLVFLHGFPEYWGTWQEQLTYFGRQHHVIAPDLPGYHLSDKPKSLAFYQVPDLIGFFAHFIQAVCNGRKVILVAHDWGGAIAWPLAAFHPQLVEKLVILNAAHPSTFTREMITNAEQRKKSEYIHDLIASDAEQQLTKNNYHYLQDKLFSTMAKSSVSTTLKSDYLLRWRIPGVINGMLNYYRAMPQLAPSMRQESSQTDQVISPDKMKIPHIMVKVPTLVLWGEQDQAFVVENLNGLSQYVQDLRVVRYPNASHWLTHEISDEINQEIEQFIAYLN